MSARFALQQYLAKRRVQRNGMRGMRPTIASKNSRDDHLITWMWLYALIAVAVFYGCEWAYNVSRDALPLRMTQEIKR